MEFGDFQSEIPEKKKNNYYWKGKNNVSEIYA